MTHRIRTEYAGQSGQWGWMRSRYRAQIIRLSDGAVVWTSERLPSAEECWEDAARQCRQRGWEAGQ